MWLLFRSVRQCICTVRLARNSVHSKAENHAVKAFWTSSRVSTTGTILLATNSVQVLGFLKMFGDVVNDNVN